MPSFIACWLEIGNVAVPLAVTWQPEQPQQADE